MGQFFNTTGQGPIAASIANFGNALASGPTLAERRLQEAQTLSLERKNAQAAKLQAVREGMARMFARNSDGTAVRPDVAGLTSSAVGGAMDPAKLSQFFRFYMANVHNQGANGAPAAAPAFADPSVLRAFVGAGGSVGPNTAFSVPGQEHIAGRNAALTRGNQLAVQGSAYTAAMQRLNTQISASKAASAAAAAAATHKWRVDASNKLIAHRADQANKAQEAAVEANRKFMHEREMARLKASLRQNKTQLKTGLPDSTTTDTLITTAVPRLDANRISDPLRVEIASRAIALSRKNGTTVFEAIKKVAKQMEANGEISQQSTGGDLAPLWGTAGDLDKYQYTPKAKRTFMPAPKGGPRVAAPAPHTFKKNPDGSYRVVH